MTQQNQKDESKMLLDLGIAFAVIHQKLLTVLHFFIILAFIHFKDLTVE